MKHRELISDLARPLLRRLPARRLGMVTALAGPKEMDAEWYHAKRRFRTFYNRQFDAIYFVDLADYLSRWHYYGAYYYDQMQRLLVRKFLAGRDCAYVDIGANVGVHTVAVARATAGRCRQVAFEPNPRCFRILQANLALNGLFDVRCHNVGLGDAEATLELSGHGDNTGMYTLRPDAGADVRIAVPVRRGDDMLTDFKPIGPMLIKIDTEGYEHFVLRGIPRMLDYEAAALSIEIVPDWLESVGTSATALFDDLYALGYRSWLLEQGGTYGKPTLSLQRIDTPLTVSSDVLFAKAAFSAELWQTNAIHF